MTRWLLCILLLVGLSAIAQDQPSRLDSAREQVAGDIASARQELNQLAQGIQEERAARLARLEALRASIAETEAALATSQATAREQATQAAADRRQAATLAELAAFQAEALLEYRRGLGVHLSPLAMHAREPRLAAIDEALAADAALAAAPLLTLSLEELEAQQGGRQAPGRVVLPDGSVQPGTLAEAGPFAWFADESGVAGIVHSEVDAALPRLYTELPREGAANIGRLVHDGAAAAVPVDPSLGEALRVEDQRDSLVEHLYKGGVTMIPLLALGLACIGLAVYKLLSLWLLRTRSEASRIAEILLSLRNGRVNDAYAVARTLRKPLGPVILEGIDHRDAPKEHIEEIMYERLLEQVPALERLLSPLAVCASVAPLLGLFGTVTGMIHTFRLITLFGTGDARVLSGGISEALITTQVGLCIAIPALLVHAYLSRRVRQAVAATQQSSIMFVNGLKLRLDDDAAPPREPADAS